MAAQQTLATLPAEASPAGCGTVFTETFGTGAPGFGGPIALPGSTSYVWEDGNGTPQGVNDGEYTLTSGITPAMGGWWHTTLRDHTGDPNGRFMLVNADSKNAGIFYERQVSGLVPGATYDFSAWVVNGTGQSPKDAPQLPVNVTLQITDSSSGRVLGSFNSGDIQETASPVWRELAASFTADGSDVVVQALNTGLGGEGNDLALDDISFSQLCDLGDAPDSYGTSLSSNGASHRLVKYNSEQHTADLMLGKLIDGESDAAPGPNADGDDTRDAADEDGLRSAAKITRLGQTSLEISATNRTAREAVLAGWIDLDGNGRFDPGELQRVPVPAGSGAAKYTLAFPAPEAGVTSTFARFRIFAEEDAGAISPTGFASGGGEVEDYKVSVENNAKPSLSLEKTVSEPGDDQGVSYSFLVENTGDVPISAIAIDERSFSGAGKIENLSCPGAQAAPLAVGESLRCSADYRLTQADIDHGSVSNTAVATGIDLFDNHQVRSNESEASVSSAAAPALLLNKRVTSAAPSRAGDPIEYAFEVTNTGNVSVRNVEITELEFSGTGASPSAECPVENLAPGASLTCVASYEVTQKDVDRGEVLNSAVATGDPVRGDAPISEKSTATQSIVAAPAMTLVKSSSVVDASDFRVGQKIDYSFVVSNTGNVTLAAIAITEKEFSGSGVLTDPKCGPEAAGLAPGSQVVCGARYTVTQSDVDDGKLRNVAVAQGAAPQGTAVESAAAESLTPGVVAPALALAKTLDAAEVTRPGQRVEYRFEVKNSGNVTVRDMRVSEEAFSGSGELEVIECVQTTLLPGEVVDCSAGYIVTQEDVDSGQLSNTATATGAVKTGVGPTSEPSTVTVQIVPAPQLSLVKSASLTESEEFKVGAQVAYSFVVTNEGNVTLSDLGVVEKSFTGTGSLSEPECASGVSALRAGEQLRCSANYTVTQEDIDAGGMINIAFARGTAPAVGDNEGAAVVSPDSEARLPVEIRPGLEIVKSVDTERVTKAGQKVQYSFVVTNTGNVTLTDPSVHEKEFSGAGRLGEIECRPALKTLLPGQKLNCGATYAVVAADLTGRELRNIAGASATAPNQEEVVAKSSTAMSETELLEKELSKTGVDDKFATFVVVISSLLAGLSAVLFVASRRRNS